MNHRTHIYAYPHHTDWETCADYDRPDADWIEVSALGQTHQLQIDANNVGHYRHRKMSVGEPWVEGLPPTKHNL